MPQFAYRARDAQGSLVEGVLDCADRAVAIRQIELQKCIPVRIELVGPEVPIRELAVLAGDEGIEQNRGDQSVGSRDARRVFVGLVFEHPFIEVAIGPGVKSFGTLPIERLVVRHECSGKVADSRRLSNHLARVAGWRWGWTKLTRRGQ